jgi:hypothetical protein
MTEFMYEGLADLMSDFSLIGADRLNVLLIKHDVIRSCGEVEDTPLRRRHAVKDGSPHKVSEEPQSALYEGEGDI